MTPDDRSLMLQAVGAIRTIFGTRHRYAGRAGELAELVGRTLEANMAHRELSKCNPWRGFIEEQEISLEHLERHARDERRKLVDAIEAAELWEREADAEEARQPDEPRPGFGPPAGS